MSHFALLVIHRQKTRPTKEELAATMQPFHEYECTGVLDQYVTKVDKTEEFEQEMSEEVRCVKLADLTICEWYDDRFNVEKPNPDYNENDPMSAMLGRKTISEHVLPEGAEETKMPRRELFALLGTDVDEWVKEYHGWKKDEETGKYYRLTNENKKWDWWVIGGRWTGFFKPNYDPNQDPRNQESCLSCYGTGLKIPQPTDEGRKQLEEALHAVRRGETPNLPVCPQCEGKKTGPVWPTARVKVVEDQIQKKDIPFEALRAEAETKAAERYDKIHAVVAGRPIPHWDKVLEAHPGNSDAARDEYHSNPVLVDLRKAKVLGSFSDIEPYDCPRDVYIKREGDGAVSAFAVLDNGKWYEKGEMGWWGMVRDEKDTDEWQTKVSELLNSLDPEDWVTVVDCHI